MDPEYIPNPDDGLDFLHRHHEHSVLHSKKSLPPRDNIISFDPESHQEQFDAIDLFNCPADHRPELTRILKANWDVFATEGLRNPILGYEATIDTGTVQPLACKVPTYGPYESQVILDIVKGLEENGVIEDDDGPWGSSIVLAPKANQEHKHWSEYVWRLCVNYRQLNTITRPFLYPSLRCDDAVANIGESKHFIIMDLYWGYWQVKLNEASKPKTAFFVPNGKKRWKRMPMGALCSHAIFCSIIDSVKKEWNALFQQRLKEKPYNGAAAAENIVDDLILHAESIDVLLLYFDCVLITLKRYSITVNLKKCNFLPAIAQFVGLDIAPDGNQPASAKFKDLDALGENPPATSKDLRAIIGFFGFYQDWIPYYEHRINP